MKNFFAVRARFLIHSSLIVCAMVVLGSLFMSRYAIGMDIQKGHRSIPHRLVLIDKADQTIERDGYVAFKAARMISPFRDGMTVVKVASGMPGDTIKLSEKGLVINGVFRGIPLPSMTSKEGETIYLQPFDGVVPEGHIFATGTDPRSYDSRYWGFVEPERIIGDAVGILR